MTGSHQCDVSSNDMNYNQARIFSRWAWGAFTTLFPLLAVDSKVLMDGRATRWKEPGSPNQYMEENHPLASNSALSGYL